MIALNLKMKVQTIHNIVLVIMLEIVLAILTSIEKAVKYDKTAPTGMVVVEMMVPLKVVIGLVVQMYGLVVKGTKAKDNLSGGVYYIYGSNANVNPIKGKIVYSFSWKEMKQFTLKHVILGRKLFSIFTICYKN